MNTSAEQVFSGVQPTGTLHLGNYLGALRQFVRMQDAYQCIFCVVDLHAITQAHDAEALRSATRKVVSTFLACGLEPERAILFNQSRVHAHAQLAWILNCTARVGWLSRMTQFKEKAGQDSEGASIGLYAYPVLMAADILAYKATHVPVGADQKQHLELARDIAQKFNLDYRVPGFFPLPEPLVQDAVARVMSLRDGTRKMSKSDPSDASRINLDDDADAIARKIRRAKTDPHPLPDGASGLAGRPEAENLLGLHAALTDRTLAEVMDAYAGLSFAALKADLTEAAEAVLGPIRDRIRHIEAEPDHVDRVLAAGSERAAAISGPIVEEVERIVGLRNR